MHAHFGSRASVNLNVKTHDRFVTWGSPGLSLGSGVKSPGAGVALLGRLLLVSGCQPGVSSNLVTDAHDLGL